MDKLAPHSKVRCSVPEVNDPVAQGEFTSLLREACAPGTAVTPRARRSERIDVGAQESAEAIIHNTESNEPVKTPDGLTTREGLNLAGSTTIAGRRLALKPNGGAGPRASVAEKSAD